jgi:hypothetical protein
VLSLWLKSENGGLNFFIEIHVFTSVGNWTLRFYPYAVTESYDGSAILERMPAYATAGGRAGVVDRAECGCGGRKPGAILPLQRSGHGRGADQGRR